MSQNYIQLRRNKTRSHNGESHTTDSHETRRHNAKQIKYSQHQKFRNHITEKLNAERSQLIKKKTLAIFQTRKSYEQYQYWKNENKEYESDFHYKFFQCWSEVSQRLCEKVIANFEAARIFEMPLKEFDFQTFLQKKAEEQMRYGPSDEE